MEVVGFKGVQFQSGMPKVTGAGKGSTIDMIVGSERHMRPGAAQEAVPPAGSFGEMLSQTVNGIEKLDSESNRLTSKAVFDPDSVEAHEVVIAAEKARFALTLTKNIADGVIRAYKEVTNPR